MSLSCRVTGKPEVAYRAAFGERNVRKADQPPVMPTQSATPTIIPDCTVELNWTAMLKTVQVRRTLAFVALYSMAMFPALSQSTPPVGAWMSRGRWSEAPKEVNHDLRAAGGQIIYFEADGTFTLWSGTLYSERHQPPTISEGDAETLYSGDWTPLSSGPRIKMRKVYADVRMKNETMPGREEIVTTQQRT